MSEKKESKSEYSFKKSFYKDDLNIAISGTKRLCRWIILDVPDLSFLMGWKRKAINIGLIFISIYLAALVLTGGITILGLVLRIMALGAITMVIYSKTVAFILLKTIEAYQNKAEEIFK